MTSTVADKTYNGWKNYETWAVALWIDNERGTYEGRRSMAQNAWNNRNEDRPDYFTESQAARYGFADEIKTWISDELMPDLGASLASDLLGAALSEVDWSEIADNWLNEEVNENGSGGYASK